MLRLFKEYTKRNMTSLNGDWLFSVDPDNIGEKEEWFKAFPKNHLNISVPGSWNTQFVNLFGYKGLGWFCRTLLFGILVREIFIMLLWPLRTIVRIIA